jgi:hypothetical protein
MLRKKSFDGKLKPLATMVTLVLDIRVCYIMLKCEEFPLNQAVQAPAD